MSAKTFFGPIPHFLYFIVIESQIISQDCLSQLINSHNITTHTLIDRDLNLEDRTHNNMYKVQNELLQQETNQGLIDIRTNELNYFTGFFSSYGSQAATLGGLMLSASTNFSLLEAEETYHRAW